MVPTQISATFYLPIGVFLAFVLTAVSLLVVVQLCLFHLPCSHPLRMPRIDSRQAAQNKRIWFTLLCELLHSEV